MFRLKPRSTPAAASDSALKLQKQNSASRAPTRDSSPSQWSRESLSRARTGVSTAAFDEFVFGHSRQGGRSRAVHGGDRDHRFPTGVSAVFNEQLAGQGGRSLSAYAGDHCLPTISRLGTPRTGSDRWVSSPRRMAERKINAVGPDHVDFMVKQQEMVTCKGNLVRGGDLTGAVATSLDDSAVFPSGPGTGSPRRRASSAILNAASADVKLASILTSPRCQRGWADKFLSGGRSDGLEMLAVDGAENQSQKDATDISDGVPDPPLRAVYWIQSSCCNAVFPIEEGESQAGSEPEDCNEDTDTEAQKQPYNEPDSENPDDGDENREEDNRNRDAMVWGKGTGSEDGLRKSLSAAARSRIAGKHHVAWRPQKSSEGLKRDAIGIVEGALGEIAQVGSGRMTQSRGRQGGRLGTEVLNLGGKRNGRKVLSSTGKAFREAKFLQGSSADQMGRLMHQKAPPGGMDERRMSKQTKVPWEMAMVESQRDKLQLDPL